MTKIKLNDAARMRVLEAIEADRAVGSRQDAADLEMLLKLHDQLHAEVPEPELKGKETAAGRISRLANALNSAITLDPSVRIASHGTRVEIRPAAGQYHDAGLDHVAEFAAAFDAHVAAEPGVPEFRAVSESELGYFMNEMKRCAEDLKRSAARALERGDEAGALLLIRLQLCQEELAELAEAMLERDIVACLDALTDMTYVTDGAYLTLGLGHYKLAALAEVHASNMSKLGEDGRPIISDAGRVVKGPNYQPPDLRSVLGVKGLFGSEAGED